MSLLVFRTLLLIFFWVPSHHSPHLSGHHQDVILEWQSSSNLLQRCLFPAFTDCYRLCLLYITNKTFSNRIILHLAFCKIVLCYSYILFRLSIKYWTNPILSFKIKTLIKGLFSYYLLLITTYSCRLTFLPTMKWLNVSNLHSKL